MAENQQPIFILPEGYKCRAGSPRHVPGYCPFCRHSNACRHSNHRFPGNLPMAAQNAYEISQDFSNKY